MNGIIGRLAAYAVALAGLMIAGAANAQTIMAVGETVRGTLQSGDSTLTSGEFVDTVTFEGRAGQQVTVNLASTEFDAYVIVRGPSGFSQDNDDRDGNSTDAQLSLRLPVDGTYRILATSYEPGDRGAYGLSLRAGSAAVSEAGGGPLRIGDSNLGQLSAGDMKLEAGEFFDTWTLTGRPGARYVVRLQAADFDPFLAVRGEGLTENNDDDPDGRGDRSSRLEFTLPVTGEARVLATSYESGESGAYTLLIEEVGAGRPDIQTASSSGNLQVGQTVAGSLQDGDQTLESGEFTRVYSLTGRAGESLALRLRSTDFDAYVFVKGPDEFALGNDDDGTGGTDSELIVSLPADGEYQVYATSFEPGETGEFQLSVAQASSAQVEQALVASRTSFETGIDTAGRLAEGDATLESGEFGDVFRFAGRRGDRVTLGLTSSDFDAYLIVRNPDGSQTDNDDSTGTTDSRIDTVLPADGEYVVTVTSLAAGETGNYRLTAGLALAGPNEAPIPSGARVFAVMVGISSYGEGGDLPYTADDATKLAESLRRGGMLNPASVTLTDAQATVAGVRSAIQQVAAEAGPEDVFLFFFSGHGGQVRTEFSATELDGKTETLVLHDGSITDEQMADLFGTLRTRMSMIVLDSCFSGGFARNVVSRRGTIGMFSSEEDLTSQVAAKFEAGGYLSHFLRTGLQGDADIDSDKLLTAGELTTYLRRKFAAEVTGVTAETIDGHRSYQELVIDRGGVQVGDVVLRVS